MSDAAGGEIGHREVTSTVPIRAARFLWEGSQMSVSRRSPLALLAAVAFVGSAGAGLAQTSPGGVPQLAIEREPPTATKPVFAPPILVPPAVPGGAAGVTAPPVPPQAIPIPPGPAPVAVPVPVQTPVTVVPNVPAPAASSAPAPQTAPVVSPPASGGSAGSDPAPVTPPAPPPSEAPAPVPGPAPAPQVPPQPTPSGPTPPSGPSPVETAPSSSAPVAPAPVAPAPTAPQGGAPVPAAPSEAVTPAPKAKLMIEEVTVEARPALFATGTTTGDKAEAVFDRLFQELADAVTKLGAKPVSGPIIEYVDTDGDSMVFRVMVPLAEAPKGKPPKGIKVGPTRGGKALLFRNEGPIEDLEEVYGRIDDELTKRGLDEAAMVEVYDADALTSPEDRTILHIWVLLK